MWYGFLINFETHCITQIQNGVLPVTFVSFSKLQTDEGIKTKMFNLGKYFYK